MNVGDISEALLRLLWWHASEVARPFPASGASLIALRAECRATISIFNSDVFTLHVVSFRTQTTLSSNGVFKTHTDDFILFFVKDVSKVGAKLLDFFLLFHDLLLKMSCLVSQFYLTSHELIPLMHALYYVTRVCSLYVNAISIRTIWLLNIVW